MEVAVNRVVAVVVQGVAVAGCKERGAAVQGVAAVAVKDVRTMVVLLHKKVDLKRKERKIGKMKKKYEIKEIVLTTLLHRSFDI